MSSIPFKSRLELAIFILGSFLVLIGIYASALYFFIQRQNYAQIHQTLDPLITRIEHDLVYENNRWDTSKYDADPLTPNPAGSGGFTFPLYILTTNGLVIDRRNTIPGVLDASDAQHLLQFTKPSYIEDTVNRKWRVLAKPITRNGQVQGVIIVSFFNPDQNIIEIVDTKLRQNIDHLDELIRFDGTTLSTEAIDIRNTHYDVSFEIVSLDNIVILSDGRVPTFIDPSYVQDTIRREPEHVRISPITQEPFWFETKVLRDSTQKPIGVIVVAQSLQALYKTLSDYIRFSIGAAIVIIIPLALLAFLLMKRYFKQYAETHQMTAAQLPIKRILFDSEQSTLHFDDRSFTIPQQSNQQHLLTILFGKPTKLWGFDEILTKLGEDPLNHANQRMLYDTALIINKKVGFKLIAYHHREFQINPDLIPLITKNLH